MFPQPCVYFLFFQAVREVKKVHEVHARRGRQEPAFAENPSAPFGIYAPLVQRTAEEYKMRWLAGCEALLQLVKPLANSFHSDLPPSRVENLGDHSISRSSSRLPSGWTITTCHTFDSAPGFSCSSSLFNRRASVLVIYFSSYPRASRALAHPRALRLSSPADPGS